MSIQQLLITEVSQQPEPLPREVWHYLSFLKSRSDAGTSQQLSVRPGFGSVLGIELADDFDAPLDDFAISLKDDLRYTPTDCFETFPFSAGWKTDAALEAAGREYDESRAALMVENHEGLTKTYNR